MIELENDVFDIDKRSADESGSAFPITPAASGPKVPAQD